MLITRVHPPLFTSCCLFTYPICCSLLMYLVRTNTYPAHEIPPTLIAACARLPALSELICVLSDSLLCSPFLLSHKLVLTAHIHVAFTVTVVCSDRELWAKCRWCMLGLEFIGRVVVLSHHGVDLLLCTARIDAVSVHQSYHNVSSATVDGNSDVFLPQNRAS
ncbi:hypothetical protein PENSPDRAFT_96615 [Peniophora sp. CONT]|nr:hypothetical protein PENSPDRAFT_96615 [Peniophora sp. CONT]